MAAVAPKSSGRRAAADRIEPYLGAGVSFLETVTDGAVRRFRRPEGHSGLAVQQAWYEMEAAKQRLPQLLSEISETALAADPLTLYSSLHVLDAMRRSSLPGSVVFDSDAVVEFWSPRCRWSRFSSDWVPASIRKRCSTWTGCCVSTAERRTWRISPG
ncbi:hypothetical protein GCM10010308_60140 [Streptomyces vinaceusdrappus]|nr:hypothetical protein GCM10010308_60140 [Streptomyces vinaceusdrappus]